mmetsp:Transcript_13188/g.38833  ORF Transcript_13188/g.38833 Transcript_13188/m.38833 type:complete len:507 (-) Transcript_13188:69-1589(-)
MWPASGTACRSLIDSFKSRHGLLLLVPCALLLLTFGSLRMNGLRGKHLPAANVARPNVCYELPYTEMAELVVQQRINRDRDAFDTYTNSLSDPRTLYSLDGFEEGDRLEYYYGGNYGWLEAEILGISICGHEATSEISLRFSINGEVKRLIFTPNSGFWRELAERKKDSPITPKSQRDQANTMYPIRNVSLDYAIERCISFTPECESHAVVEERWGANVVRDYNQLSCCIQHGLLRTATVEVFDAISYHNGTAWLDSGSVIGIERHNGTMIPWDGDADIAFLVAAKDEEPVLGLPAAPSWLDGTIHWVEGIVATLNRNAGTHEEGGRLANWMYVSVHPPKRHNYCMQYNLHKSTIIQGEIVMAQVDLFGFSRHLPPKTIGNETLISVNYPGCFRNKRAKDIQSYYNVPPSRCRFYDTYVWCPRDARSYIKGYFGENALGTAMSHNSFYGGEGHSSVGSGLNEGSWNWKWWSLLNVVLATAVITKQLLVRNSPLPLFWPCHAGVKVN